jgi:non-heme chloroperoxidase
MTTTENSTRGLRRSMTESSDGCAIAYWSGGNPAGIPVILLHGFSLDHSVWSVIYEQPELLNRCHIIAPDMRGHGESGRLETANGYADGRAWADDIAAVIRSSGADCPAVVAWSYSGRMLFDYIQHYGTRSLRCLNLVAAASLTDPAALGPDHGCLEALCSSDPEIVEAASARFISDVLRITRGRAEYALFSKALGSTTPEHRGWMRRRPLDYDRLIAELDVPVLISHGRSDCIVLPTLAARLGQLIPGSRVSIYDDCGHAPFLEDPRRFGSELLKFVSAA